MKVFIVLSYTSDAPHTGECEGVYSTKRLAFKKVMALKAEQENTFYRDYGFRDTRFEIKETELDK